MRSVKASHATSDVPDPSVSISTELPHTPEPEFLKHLENVIADPAGHSPDVAGNLARIPESIGYLKDTCGLDYGWGPTATMETLLETLHITGGLSWTASIVGVALIYRAVVAVFVYRGADQAAKLKAVMPAIEPIRNEMQKATAEGDMPKRSQLAAEIQAINKEIGFNPVKLFLPIIIQIPLGFAGFRLLRGCSAAPVPAFATESWLWNVDLTASDPYYIVPILQGALLYFSVTMSQRSGNQALSGPMGSFLIYGLPGISMIWTAFQPGGVQLFFLTSTILAAAQAWAMQNNRFRRAIWLMEMPSSAPQTGPINPGGMNRYSAKPPSSAKIIDVEPSKAPTRPSNGGVLSKVVDSAKDKLSWGTVKKQASEKMENRQKAADLQKFEKHEYKRRRELEQERERKNFSNAAPKTTIGPGGMQILKKAEPKRKSSS